MPAKHTYLITGGTGSFGQAMTRALLKDPTTLKVCIYSRDEVKHHAMSVAFDHHPKLRHFIGDVRDQARLIEAMREVDTVIHAAAMKRVEMCEYNPDEAFKTNIGGTHHVRTAALATGVRRILALSSDKACSPNNVYGISKAALEAVTLAGHIYGGKHGARFSVLRYGNVAGSRGSVIPTWQDRLRRGLQLQVTHEQCSRFWYTLPQAVDFARWVLKVMQGGELFVPQLPSFHIMDLAQAMAPDTPVQVIGMGRGEKLHESMVSADESPWFREWQGYFVRFPEGDDRGLRLPDGFRYQSDENGDWLDVDQLRALVGGLEMAA